MRLVAAAMLVVLAIAGPVGAEGPTAASCVRIEGVRAFAPRGEVYVRVAADCREADFEHEDSVLAYLEVLVGERRVVGEDVRVYADKPRVQRTFSFRDLALVSGDPVLVRLVRFGEILDLTTVKVP